MTRFFTTLLTFFGLNSQTRLCNTGFMKTATAADIRAEIAKGADVNARDDTPLLVAALIGNAEVVNALLAAGANGAAKNSVGKTPFDIAKDNDRLKDTKAYRLLNDARFK